MFESINGRPRQLNDLGVYDPGTLPSSRLDNPIIIGSGVKIYHEELRSKYDSLNPTFIEEDCALAGVVARLAKNRLGDVFDLANASPIYIRNKVANTIIERQKNKKS